LKSAFPSLHESTQHAAHLPFLLWQIAA
jgi:hypothetical protein